MTTCTLLQFVDASPKKAKELMQFALDSNAVYGDRTVSDQKALKIFRLTPADFETGAVQTLHVNGELVGFFCLRIGKNRKGETIQELSHLFIKRGWQGKGMGRQLFARALEVAEKELGWQALEWESDRNAAWFYEKMGAIQIGTVPSLLNPKYECPVFQTRLAPLHHA